MLAPANPPGLQSVIIKGVVEWSTMPVITTMRQKTANNACSCDADMLMMCNLRPPTI